MVECKASRADYKADQKKWHRKQASIADQRYYLAPEGMLSVDELPERWGLLKPSGQSAQIVRQARDCPDVNCKAQTIILLSALRRVGLCSHQGISVKTYQYETLNTATLGIALE